MFVSLAPLIQTCRQRKAIKILKKAKYILLLKLANRSQFRSLLISGVIGAAAMLMLALLKNLTLTFAILSLMAASAGVAIADVTIDACVTENSISHPSLAGDMQSLCGVSSSTGSLVGFLISGFLLHIVGPKVCVYSLF